MTADDKSDGSGSSNGSAASIGAIEKIFARENNVRARVGLYMKDGVKLRADFHALYRALPDLRKKKDRRKVRRKAKSNRHHKDKKKKGEVAGGSNTCSSLIPVLELPGNPSSFAVYAHVRGLVLENAARQAQGVYLATTQPLPSDSDTDDDGEKGRELTMQIPKMVGLGLVSVYELIRGSVSAYPALCIRALEALLDILQGQQPEALRSEPPEVIDALFSLLLRLATASNGDVLTCPSSPLVGVACACLLSLVVARGETGKFLRATADILMTSRQLASQSIQVPVILTFLQRSVHAVLLGKTSRPDWLICGVPKSALIDKFSVKIMTDGEESKEDSTMTCDGHYLYIHNAHGLFKIGSGFGGTMKGHVYIHRPDFYPKQKGWLGFAHGDVFYRPEGSNGELVVIDREVLKVSEVYQCSAPGWSRGLPFSDGINIGHISPDREDGFVVRTYNPLVKPMPLVNELSLNLAIKCIQILGGPEQHSTLSAGLDEDIVTVAAGKDFTLVRTLGGRIYYNGKASSVGMKQGSSGGGGGNSGAASGNSGACPLGTSYGGGGGSGSQAATALNAPTTSNMPSGRWPELTITKSPRIVHLAVGHEGQHAVLISDDGAAFFVGTARRGEDGDASKGRRQPKPVKPKKMIKLDGQFVVSGACNNGTSALVTRDGELYMFGKDTSHCDSSTGLVTDLRDVHVSAVSLGKAHALALTNKGQVFSFGINNKGQCGRDFVPQVKEGTGMSMSVGPAGEEEVDDEDGVESEEGGESGMCPPGRHRWVRDHCLVCTVCHECTGYGAACVSSGRPDRNSGQPCGCGSGDSGCAECGCCRACADEIEGDSDQDPFSLMQGQHSGLFGFPEVGNLGGNIFGRACGRLQDQLQRRLDERRHRPRHRHSRYAPTLARKGLGGQASAMDGHTGNLGQFEARLLRLLAPSSNPPAVAGTGSRAPAAASPDPAGLGVPAALDPLATSNILVAEDGIGSDQERDASKIAALSPARVHLTGSSPVIQVTCGLHHSVVLCANGETYTWGSNSYGQLGVGDLISRGSPVMIRLPPNVRVTQVAAGSNHTVFLTSNGQIYSCGDFQKGQLGRGAPQSDAGEGSSRGRCPWYSVPGLVPGIGPRLGCRATWIGVSADVTYVKLDQSLINAHNLSAAAVVANSNCLVLLPVGGKKEEEEGWKCLVISRSDGQCRSFSTQDQICFTGHTICLDPVYNVLWSYDNCCQDVHCYNIVAAEAQRLTNGGLQDGLRDLLSPELSLPILPEYQVSRAQVALHMLSCIDTVTWAHEHGLTVVEDDPQTIATVRVYTREDFTPVNRFESHGGGWGYSGHSIEAIRFMCDTDILIGGFGLFGGRGEYMGKIKLFELGAEGGDQETDGELLAETEEMPYECGARQKFPMLFDEPVPLQANKWYVAWARVSGPSSDCGSSGQSMVTTEDQVIFYFKSSKKSNNGTDVNAGQIPQLLYRIMAHEGPVTPRPVHESTEAIPILSKSFFMSVRNDVFQSLLDLLGWAWSTLRSCVGEQVSHVGSTGASPTVAMLDLQRLVYICCACLRLLRIYINEVYPNSVRTLRSNGEKGCLAESVADVRGLLRQMLSDPIPSLYPSRKGKMRNGRDTGPLTRMVVSVLDECHKTFVSCFHAFYPTGQLKWACLCDLLQSRDVGMEETRDSDRLLSAVLASLCSPTVKLRATCPILTDPDAEVAHRPSPADNAALSTLQPGDLYRYPLLVEHMTYKTHQVDNGVGVVWTFREVLDRLLGVACGSVRQALRGERVTPLPALVHNTCLLMAATVAELSAETNSAEGEVPAGGRVLHITPSRFTRTSQSRTWNTGNGSPDAICFAVDRPGIVIAGVCVYGGVGTYDYEVEVMDESGGGGQDPSHTLERWNVMEMARGTFGPDDSVADIVEIKFERPVPIKEGVKYAIRLCNHGGRTSNGDGGLASVKGPDGTAFTFSACSLSVNGTNHIRGQIPHIMYYSTPQDPESQRSTREIAEQQARKSALAMAGSIVRVATELMIMGLGVGDETAVEVLGSAPLLTMLLPLVLSHIGPVATSDPRSAVTVLGLIQEILPHVAALNNLSLVTQQTAVPEAMEDCHTTTSHHYAWMESDHPYRPASVANYRVTFPAAVQWMTLEFDPQCGTAQPEDSLQVYIPSLSSKNLGGSSLSSLGFSEVQDRNTQVYVSQDGVPLPPYWAVLNKFSGTQNWPEQTVILPGHEVLFSLETASDYVKDDRANTYGFRVLIVGYEWPPTPPDSLRHLEKELSYLGGLCAASLIKKDLCLPPIAGDDLDEDMELVEDLALQVYQAHPTLLSKGFALSHPPTIHQTLDGVIPFSCHSNERLFLRDFVSCAGGTSGGRLARWLQPDSYVDVRACEVLYSRDDMRAGWPAIVTILTRDQYSEVVHVPSLKVEVVAVPVNTGEEGNQGKLRRISQHVPDNMTFGGHPQPSLDVPYQVSIKDKMCYCAITMIKAYDNYSFEELRYMSPAIRRPTENMLVRSNNDGTYSCNWTPGATGWYSLHVTIDGYQLEETYKMEVKEPPQGVTPPVQSTIRRSSQQPSRLRKFVLQNSAGLRIRTHPSLQSEQIGIVHVNGTIAFVDEVHNSDGVWLRLSPESIRQYCTNGYSEAWCLQYNQHLGKTLLVPLDHPKTILDQVITDTISRRRDGSPRRETSLGADGAEGASGGAGMYTVVKCGASGHNIRSQPNLKAPPVGMLVLGNVISADCDAKNADGTWVRLDSESTRKYCFTDGEAWSLAMSRGHTLYLQRSHSHSHPYLSSMPDTNNVAGHQGFDFTHAQTSPVFRPFQQPAVSGDPFVFGALTRGRGDGSSSAGIQMPVTGGDSSSPQKSSLQFVDANTITDESEATGITMKQQQDSSQHPGKFSVLHRWLKEEQHKHNPPHAPLVQQQQQAQQQQQPQPPQMQVLQHPQVQHTQQHTQTYDKKIEKKQSQQLAVSLSRDVPPELQGVSVKELVKAIGESRANGNGATPPRTPPATPKRLSRSSSPRAIGVGSSGSAGVIQGSGTSPRQISRSSSPVPIPGRGRESASSSPLHSSPRATGISPLVSGAGAGGDRAAGSPPSAIRSANDSLSDTSAFVSSLTQDMSHSPSVSSLPTSTPSTPRREPLSTSPKTVTQTATQTSPEGIKFNIGSTGSRDENLRLSPKMARKDRSGKPHRGKRDHAVSPASSQREKPGPNRDKVKEAMSPSVAECLRAIFAAFLWHEGIVHDAMACASYMKFHPDLTKQGTFHWKPRTATAAKSEKLTKEQKARQRHSVEVSTYSYLNNVTLQNTDDLLKPGKNANINEVPRVSDTSDDEAAGRTGVYVQGPQGQKLATVMEGGTGPDPPDLPPVLRHVVLLWEELTSSCLKAVAQQIILPSPTIPARLKKSDKIKEKSDREKKKHKKKSSSSGIPMFGIDPGDGEDEDGVCELCGSKVSPEGIEQHFRTLHQGCGGSSKGCGYVGTHWKVFPTKDRVTQPCGEVVRGCFHMCWSCRNRHKGQYSQFSGSKISNGRTKRKSNSKLLSPLPQLDAHVIMRNNAMFLLDLASAAAAAIPCRSHVPRRSPCTMPSVSLSPDNSPFPKVAFQCLHTLNCQQQHLNQLREDLLLHHNFHAADNNDYRSSSAESRDNNHREHSPFSPQGASHQESPASDTEMPRGRPFHRSISVTVGTSGQDWSSAAASASASQVEHDHKATVILRKRNNSSGENAVDSGGSSLLVHPSAALERLAGCIERGGGPAGDPGGRARQVIIRPIMAFIFQNHDLETLAFAMRHATRKAAARVYAMQALNWLLRSVTQPTCLHDLLWCFVAALTPSNPPIQPPSDDHNPQDHPHLRDKSHDLDGDMVVLEHPLSDVTLAGDAVHPLPRTFHQLLQTVADLMMLLPPGSPLQMMAVRCWGLRFTPTDHDFLHQSHVFSNISKILSRSEEVLGAGEEGVTSMYESHGPVTSIVECLQDLMSECEIRASSRQAMVPSLTDSSTETFWESGDEDRNKTKALTITCPSSVRPQTVYVHIDNCRDLGNKVSSVVFKCGGASDDMVIVKKVDVESRFTGWIHAVLPSDLISTIVIEIRGPDQSVRVRQVRALGTGDGEGGMSSRPLRQHSPLTIQHRACEQETLKVFRLITGQVFGRLIITAESGNRGGEAGDVCAGHIETGEEQERNNDLREHMVGILFSRSKLTHLQKQVCAHIVQAIRKETVRAREEWEAGLSCGGLGTPATPEEGQNNPPDTYCFEMLSMVLALSGSAVGRAHLAQQDRLLRHLLSLLHTGSARVQRQVVALFRRMLADVPPQSLALIVGVDVLPAQDYAILHAATKDDESTFDIHKQGILDVFLAVIAKALTVQLKTKGSEGSKSVMSQGKGGVTSVTLATTMPTPTASSPRWWLQGSATQKQADLIISLIRDMTMGKLSDAWAKVSKAAIAENIINLTRLNEGDRSCAATCLATPTLWLALASLCVLHPDHVDALSSQHWQATTTSGDPHNPEPRPTCENHDDGETPAMILCEECGSNLCGECDRILHLHRRTRLHHRTVFRQEQEAIKVDLHEGCGRTKLFWLLALADSTTLKAMLELRGENQQSRGAVATSACRFCGAPAQPSLLSPAPVCQDQDCQEYNREACVRTHDCGHLCGGLKGESSCLPCLHGCSNTPSLKQDADDMCMICFSEALSAAPAIQLECGHVFHAHCCRTVLTRRWPGPRITFTFSLCPICKVRVTHGVLAELLGPISALYEDVRRKALMRLEYEGLHRAEAISTPGARYYNNPAAYAMDRYAYYVCFKCNKAYYGGEARCDVEAGLGDEYDPRELVCGACSDVSRAQMCPKHGTDFLEYKCRYCCSVAVFFCFGTTHFCNACHDDFQRVTNIPKAELPHCPAGPRAQQLEGEECPLHVQHPPTGEEFALGCGVCRNAHTF
ncbi:E3 ubiquitin-protein ligase MYCBP2 isoform X3 [Cherax quadricarinatus]|uniref:E3 ubiquitin-protein ligase MYCBP2 isoform X3 n=1 Tax=Cherax quadricarinatus TaxID=27406 RepID=UPI00387EA7D8